MTTTTDRSAEILAAVRDLVPTLQERAPEIEAARQIPADLHDRFKEIGLYRMLAPRSYGGDQIGLLPALAIIEEISAADGSVGWTEVIGLQTASVLSLLPRETFDAIYAEHGPDVTIGGAINPGGGAERVEGGYLVTGRWSFASGCNNWDLLFATCPVVVGGQAQSDPATGQPVTRCVAFPRRKAVIEDSWRTVGLRGTGSHHFRIDEPLFVPEEWSCPTFLGAGNVPGVYKYPIIEFGFHIAAIVNGIAQGAINDVVEGAKTRKRKSAQAPLAETPVAQYKVGTFDTALRASRESLRVRADQLVSGELGDDFLQLMVRVWADNAWRADLAVDIVGRCFRMFGAAAIWDDHPLQRRLRDAYTIGQHASTADASLTRAGAQLFGQPVGFFY
jgi:alkylation response protein AidB-like acyl-CoA dehydrogenase